MSRVLIAGESWVTESTHIKGVDAFTVHSYTEGVGPLRDALRARGHAVEHLPAHLVPSSFPDGPAALAGYDVVILSDIGANSLQLSPSVFDHARPGADRIAGLVEWVSAGGGLMMVGGYLSFTGFEAKAAYRQTALADVLPVDLLDADDRVERPAGVHATVLDADHAALGGVTGAWPALLGYNRVLPSARGQVLVRADDDPLVAVGAHGDGRVAVFTSDCSPHWAPTAFCEEWEGYGRLMGGLVEWAGGGGR